MVLIPLCQKLSNKDFTTLTAKTVIRHTFPAFLLAFALDSGNKWKYQARLEEWKRVANSRQTSETAKKEVENTTESDTIKLDNLEVRKRYLEKVSEIKDKIDQTLPIAERARKAFEMRNKIRTEARKMMADEETRKRLDKERPNKTFEELVQSKMTRKGLTREEVIQDVYNTATKTNADVNKELGLGGE